MKKNPIRRFKRIIFRDILSASVVTTVLNLDNYFKRMYNNSLFEYTVEEFLL